MKEKNKKISVLKIILILFLICFSILLYARFIGTSGIKVKEHKIEYELLPDYFHGLKIIHLSDIHYGSIINDKRLKEIVDKINFINPDIVVLTGDLIDKDLPLTNENIKNISAILSSINVSIDKYAIRGNHDYFFEEWEQIIQNSDFKNLDNTFDYIYKDGYSPILIAGLSSISDKVPFIERYEQLQKEINNQNGIYQILLLHEPDLIENINLKDYNLVLAGHSHNGQVRLPFIGAIVKAKFAEKYYDEYYKIQNTDLYISSGIGTSDLDFRLFNRPSFNFYRLTNK